MTHQPSPDWGTTRPGHSRAPDTRPSSKEARPTIVYNYIIAIISYMYPYTMGIKQRLICFCLLYMFLFLITYTFLQSFGTGLAITDHFQKRESRIWGCPTIHSTGYFRGTKLRNAADFPTSQSSPATSTKIHPRLSYLSSLDCRMSTNHSTRVRTSSKRRNALSVVPYSCSYRPCDSGDASRELAF